jgi:DNA-binding transcriptional LysR family regulator
VDKLQSMRAFAQIADCGSFTAAAERVNLNKSFMSRSISELEASLQTRLLQRTTRRIALTEAGKRYLEHCRRILSEIDEADAEASNSQGSPTGTLRVHATPSLGQYLVAPAAAIYRNRYPNVCVELALSQDAPDLIDSRYDVAMRMCLNPTRDSGFVAVKLGTSYSVLCASPTYLERHGTPWTIDDLRTHACTHFITPFLPADQWQFHGPEGKLDFSLTNVSFRSNNAEAMAAALCQSVGIGPLPASSAIQSLKKGDLVRVLPDHRLQNVTLHAMYASRRYLDTKIQKWVEVLREVVPDKLSQLDSELTSEGEDRSKHASFGRRVAKNPT